MMLYDLVGVVSDHVITNIICANVFTIMNIIRVDISLLQSFILVCGSCTDFTVFSMLKFVYTLHLVVDIVVTGMTTRCHQ